MLLEVPTLSALASMLAPLGGKLVLLVAADCRDLRGAELADIASDLIAAGACYVCTWGPDCERFHDCVDEADVSRTLGTALAPVIMTTWHDDESLEEAVWFALNCTDPDDAYVPEVSHLVLATVGDATWAEQIRAYLAAGAPDPGEA